MSWKFRIITKCSQDLKYSVSLPHGTIGWPVVCDCDIPWSFSPLAIIVYFKHDRNTSTGVKEARTCRKHI